MSTTTAERGRMWRSRWAAIGAAMAVIAGIGGVGAAFATSNTPVTVSVTPCRLVDTRAGGGNVGPRSTPLGQGQSFSVRATGKSTNCTIPVAATSVMMNVTVVNGTASSYLTVWPTGAARPTASNLNWRAGDGATPNFVSSAVGTAGQIDIYNFAGTVDVVVDVTGYTVGHGPAQLSSEQLAENRWDLNPERPANIAVNPTPYGLASDGDSIYVTSRSQGTLQRIDPRTNVVTGSLYLGSTPAGVAFDGAYLWVSLYSADVVVKVDAATFTSVKPVNVGNGPDQVMFDGSRIWVANNLGNTLTRINPATDTVLSTVPVGAEPLGMSFDGSTVWVANSAGTTVSRVTASSGAVLSSVTVGNYPQSIAFDGQFIWVAILGNSSVTRVNPLDLSAISSGSILEGAPASIAFDGHDLWATMRLPDEVQRVDRETRTATKTIAMPNDPEIALWDGTSLWVSDAGSSLVSKLDVP